MPYANAFQIFAEKDIAYFIAEKKQGLITNINSKPDNYILNVNETEYIDYLCQEFSINNLIFKKERLFISSEERDIPAEHFPRTYYVVEGRSYKRDVIKYHLPFEGDAKLLRCKPSSRIWWTTEVTIEDDCVCFEVVNFYNDSEPIKRIVNEILDSLAQQAANVINEVETYNLSVPAESQKIFKARKKHLLEKNNLLASLGVPIKKQNEYSETFAVPTPQTRKPIRITPPEVKESGFRPEPTLDDLTYKDILQVIHDMGKQFERMPSTYASKQEEELRDHLLLMLEPRFQGTATGETFNKTGKTDILLRHEGSNVFIAECKFWKGAKAFLDTITQLLGYLTWRDSKAAVVIFVENKGFSSVLSTTEQETPNHPNYLGFVSKTDETWLNYRFHINDDPNREVRLAVLLFHIPKI